MHLKREKSEELRKRSLSAIAQGTLTNSKHPMSFVQGVYPTHVDRSEGCFLYDVDGNRFVDFVCSLGANLIGAANPKINHAITEQIKKGSVYSLASRLEVELAEKIQGLFPYIERIKIVKSGTEGCSAAIKIARAFTERKLIISEGYHGWSDEFTSLTPPARGVLVDNYKDISVLGDDAYAVAAAFIIEPVITDITGTRLENLKRIRKYCDETGALLIYDETITGLRFPGLSVANWCGIRPDLTVMGKSLGAGLPLTIVGGRKDVMDCEYFVSSTFAGDCAAIAASLELLNILKGDITIDRIWNDGERFLKSFNSINPDVIKIVGYPTRGAFISKDEITKALFMQECVKAGVLFHPVSWFWNFKHNEEAFDVLKICEAVIHLIEHGQVQLQGALPKAPFSQRART